ncbi:MAG: DUF58 domain-containing protein, partial [Clostridia bacterium]|nr:DUF58 domain-containing protein [Clostridia bacterium]
MIRNRIIFGLFAVSALLLYFFENNTGTRFVLVCTIALPLSSICLACIAGKSVRLHVKVPDRVTGPGIIHGRLMIESPIRVPGFAVQAGITMTHSLLSSQTRHTVISDGAQAAFDCEALACGAMEFSLDQAETRDLFGLWSFPLTVSESAICLIEPETYPVSMDSVSAAMLTDEAELSAGQSGQNPFEVSGYRSYMPGDRVQDIHWKLSAKTDQLLIREGERPSEHCILLCLDRLYAFSGDGAVLDESVTALASVSEELSRAGFLFGIGLRGRFEHLVRSETERQLILSRLLLGDLPAYTP